MSKLSFVALSLQTTHLDPASVSKVSYVKLVDGNITRQDDIHIIPPTRKKKAADEPAESSLTPWNAALEKLGMMIGKLPIVSYYRDADKEIFHAASRQLNIEPPALHWLDCRDLARKLLPELPDVQLSTVLKTLDLYDDYADSSAVEQTTQIVIALAQRQGAKTVAQLWDELYDQPENFLGLDSTFEGAAESGSSTDDEDAIDAPLAAQVLPFAAAAGAFSQSEEQEHATEQASDHTALAEESVDDESSEATASSEELPSLEETDAPPSSAEADSQLPADEEATAVDQTPPPVAGSSELPLFLQEPTRDERDDLGTESAEPVETPDNAPEVVGPTAVTSLTDTGTEEEDVDSADTARNEDDRAVDASDVEDPTVDENVEELPNANHTPPLVSETPSEEAVEPVDGTPAELVVEDTAEPNEQEDPPAFLNGHPSEEVEQQDVELEPLEVEHAEPAALGTADDELSDGPHDQPPRAEPRETPAGTPSEMPTVITPIGDRSLEPPASTSQARTVQPVKVSERPRVEGTSRQTSNVNQIFGFVGLFVFGLISIIGVVLVVMAVMLFFTENSLMLETKIAGVILTLAITLLSLLMTNVSYRSFRKK